MLWFRNMTASGGDFLRNWLLFEDVICGTCADVDRENSINFSSTICGAGEFDSTALFKIGTALILAGTCEFAGETTVKLTASPGEKLTRRAM
jgi:hypothetical protein